MTLHFLNDVINDFESTQKNINTSITTSLNSESACMLINRIHVSGLSLFISSLPGSALRTHAESLGKAQDVNKRSQSLAW